MRIGLFFGTFNPIHIGHLSIASGVLNSKLVDEVWFVVSPKSPDKKKDTLLEDYHRLSLVNVAIESNHKMRLSNVEFGLPKPSYTSKTLAVLAEKHPNHDFSIIMGFDNLLGFHKWKNFDYIIKNHKILVYPRKLDSNNAEPNSKVLEYKSQIKYLDFPLLNISASYIRQLIKEGDGASYLLTEPVYKYIDEMNFYR